MSATKAIQETFAKEFAGKKDKSYDYKAIQRERMIGFRKEKQAIVRLDKPTNIAKARTLGYKAKKGLVVVRVRVRRGSGAQRRPKKGRKPKRMGVNKLTRAISIKGIAEQRASRKYENCEVLNSYKIGADGKHHYYEVILVDTSAPEIKSDKDLNWLCEKTQKGRAERGLTSAGKKSRGLRRKGKGAEKIRPSLRAKGRKGK
ncbi:MAG: 50S ribosomal protein L15e [Candidatus Diapherotrites archaeon]|uniref:50S ribosomal protein L15e n=1 Tax=Candidatus Iainarchaeum sp. TaxID=3101447 RepID=A0A2D6M1F9_9ARCH|nr:50S ribosomal protein L15e [Candidatus Diapherotrites archaeon]|tara:strand:+ start:217 stop:822 length:606 start_codon:yes stop_codon:yes gene_type:complete